jgi:hypothetical protein
MKKREFTKMYTAVCGTGCYRYIENLYDHVIPKTDPNIVNMQFRYWIEAVEKFFNLPSNDYDESVLEEGILIINLLANSLLILGGANYKGSGNVPPLEKLYAGDPFPLKREKPELYKTLCKLNNLYNKLSKHFCPDRKRLYPEITYDSIRRYFKATSDIWLWVCNEIHKTNEFDILFGCPWKIINHPYFPKVD